MASPFNPHIERAVIDPVCISQSRLPESGRQSLNVDEEGAIDRDKPCQGVKKPWLVLFIAAQLITEGFVILHTPDQHPEKRCPPEIAQPFDEPCQVSLLMILSRHHHIPGAEGLGLL